MELMNGHLKDRRRGESHSTITSSCGSGSVKYLHSRVPSASLSWALPEEPPHRCTAPRHDSTRYRTHLHAKISGGIEVI
jgi:hypothetical protein